MATIASLIVNLGLNSAAFGKGTGKARTELTGLNKAAAMAGAAAATMQAAFSAAVNSISTGLGLAAKMEQDTVAFEVMLGSAEKAKQVLADLNTFAAATPFELPGIITASRQLLAFGTEQEKLQSTLKAIGDISAGISAPIEEIAELYGKARVQGTLFSEDINQMTGRGIPIIQELAKQLGVAESEVKKMASQGKVQFAHLEEAFRNLTADGGKFANLMEKQSTTLAGTFSTLKDNVGALQREIGERLLPVMLTLSNVALRAVDYFKEHGRAILNTVAAIAAVVAAAKAFTLAMQAVAAAQRIVLALSGPKGWAILAVGLGIAATAAYATDQAFQDVAASANKAVAEANKATAQTTQAAAVKAVPGAAKETEKAAKEAAKAAAEMLKTFAELEAQLKEEKALLAGISAEQHKVNELRAKATEFAMQIAEHQAAMNRTGDLEEIGRLQKEIIDLKAKEADINRLADLEAEINKTRELTKAREEAAEAQKEAVEELRQAAVDAFENRRNDVKGFVEGLLNSAKTKQQRFQEGLAKIAEEQEFTQEKIIDGQLVDVPLFTAEQSAAAEAQLRKDIFGGQKDTDFTAGAALEAGTQGAYSAIVRAMGMGGEDKVPKEQLREQRQGNKHLAKIAARPANQFVVMQAGIN